MPKFIKIFAVLAFAKLLAGEEWRSFRGPTGMGVTQKKIPLSWNSNSIVWKARLPGSGQSSVVEAGDRIFVTAGENSGAKRSLLCLSKTEGRIVWKKTITFNENEDSHRMNGWCTPTPATFENRVVAFFGPAGLFCFSTEGEMIWSLDLGTFPGNWGVAASPVISGGVVYQNCDSMGPSRLLAIDLESGKIKWDCPRAEKPRGGWSTPIFIEVDGQRQLILNGEYGVRAYDPANGEERWFCKGFNGRGAPVPFYGNDLVYVVNGKPGDLYAVSPDGRGDVSKTRLKWHAKRNGGRDLPSPMMLNDLILVTSMSGVITCYDAKTGETHWIDRLKGAFVGSPLASKDHYYIQNERGTTYVVSPDKKKLKLVAVNQLETAEDEVFRSTLSPIDEFIFARSQSHLYCIRAN